MFLPISNIFPLTEVIEEKLAYKSILFAIALMSSKCDKPMAVQCVSSVLIVTLAALKIKFMSQFTYTKYRKGVMLETYGSPDISYSSPRPRKICKSIILAIRT